MSLIAILKVLPTSDMWKAALFKGQAARVLSYCILEETDEGISFRKLHIEEDDTPSDVKVITLSKNHGYHLQYRPATVDEATCIKALTNIVHVQCPGLKNSALVNVLENYISSKN
jgi:hypothetical protein